MDKYNKKGNIGISFFGVVGVILIILKLLGMINCSWFVVLLPLWLPTAILFVIISIFAMMEVHNDRKNK